MSLPAQLGIAMATGDIHGLEGLALLDVGVAVFDKSSRLAYCNPAFRDLRHYPEKICLEGVTLEALLRFNAERGDFGPGDADEQVAERLNEIEQTEKREIEREMADGQILRIRYRRTPSGGLLVTFEDRTEERRAQAALAASEERYALVAEAAEEAIYEWDIVSGRFYASPRLKALIGREWGEGGARPWVWEEIIHPDDRKHYGDCLESHLSGEDERWECEYRIEDATGALRWVSDHGTSIRGKDGRAIRMVAAVRDITERVEKDAALTASEERHILVTRATSDGIYDWNVTDDLLFVSENLTRLLDFDLGNQSSTMWAERVHPDDYPGYRAAIRAHFKGEAEAVDREYRVHAKGGGYRWVHDRGVGVRDENGRVTRLVGAVRDVTDIKEAKAELDRTEARLAASLATISDGILLVDPENRVQLWNERYYEIFSEAAGGADLSQIIVKGRPFFDMIRDGYRVGMFKPHPKGVDAWVAARRKAWDKPVSQWELELANGTWILLNERRMPDGGRVSVYTDITDLKAREAEAQAARERFEEAIEAISSGFTLWDADDRLVVCNSRYRYYFSGFADMVVPGVSFREIIFTAIKRGMFPGVTDAEAFLAETLEKRSRTRGEPREQHLSDGTWLQITDHRTAEGGIVSIYTEVTELKTRQAEAQAARERFEEAIEAISSGFSLWDAEGRLVVCNSRYRELYQELADIVKPGVRFRDVVSKAIERGLIPAAKDDPEAYLEEHARLRESGVGQLREHRMAGGLWLQITDHRTADGGIVSIHTDVTELKNREEELRQKSAILEQTLENMGQGITLVDKNLRTLAFNKKFFELLELPEDRFGHGFTMEEAFRFNAERGEYGPGDIEEQVRERVELAAKFLPHRFERGRADGTVIEIVGNPMEGGGFVSTYTDITERKQREAEITRARDVAEAALADLQKTQQRLIQAEKMASLGQLTAGIAHEIKNPLNFVNNFSRLSEEMVGELAEILEAPLAALDAEARDDAEDLLKTVRENLAKITQHGKRADSIVKNMLMHAREGPSERQSVGLNAIVDEALNLAYHGARAEHPGFNIEMVRELDPDVGEIECYPQDLMRVFLNLVSNGMYAADRCGADAGAGFSPTISLTTRAHDDRIEIEVRDNGAGIPPELRDRIFIPFFTTKPAGEGTGLGLSLSYDIVVKQHGGDIEVESEPGAFTMFRVTLPRQLPESKGDSG